MKCLANPQTRKRMTFQYPGFGVAWLTPSNVMSGPAVASYELLEGSEAFAFFWITIAVFALLTWFQQRRVAIPLILYLLIALISVVSTMITDDVDIGGLDKFALNISAIYEIFSWSTAVSTTPSTSFESDEEWWTVTSAARRSTSFR